MATAALSTTVRKAWFLDELLQSVHLERALDLSQRFFCVGISWALCDNGSFWWLF